MKDLQKLIQDHKRLIESESAKYAQFVPMSVVLAEAYKIANEAARTYDEKSGFKFSTHLHNSLKKLSRISTQYGGTIRVPEGSQFKIQKLNQFEAELKEELGREPNLHELSEASHMSLSQVTNLLKARKKDVNINNMASTPIFLEGEDDDWLHFVYHDLNNRDRLIFEHKIGYGGKSLLSNEDIAKKLKISPSTVANRVHLISTRIAEGMK